MRVAARGSGAGSLVNHLLGISGVDPIRHNLLMERFLSPLRAQLPDIDVDVESARRPEVYEAILARFGAERVTGVSMMDSYRIRHAIRDVGSGRRAATGRGRHDRQVLPHIRAHRHPARRRRASRTASLGLATSASTCSSTWSSGSTGCRTCCLHPCGVILPTQACSTRPRSKPAGGFPKMSMDEDDVEEVRLLKLDVLVRVQSAMACALDEITRSMARTRRRRGSIRHGH